MQSQPSNRALEVALHAARVLTSRKSLEQLRTLRDKRTTWFGAYELQLRRECDAVLEGAA